MTETRTSTAIRGVALGLTVVGIVAAPARGQEIDQREAVLAVAEAALEAITQEDMAAVADLFLDEAVTFAVTADGMDIDLRTMSVGDWRAMTPAADLVERGFDAEVRVAGPVANVWLPYDFYIDGALSHCGVDVFTLLRTELGWRIAGLTFTRSQPPECALHPEGPPAD